MKNVLQKTIIKSYVEYFLLHLLSGQITATFFHTIYFFYSSHIFERSYSQTKICKRTIMRIDVPERIQLNNLNVAKPIPFEM